jgi:hypothetical protein
MLPPLFRAISLSRQIKESGALTKSVPNFVNAAVPHQRAFRPQMTIN